MMLTDRNKPCKKCLSDTNCLDCNPVWQCAICESYFCSSCLPNENGICDSCNEDLRRYRGEETYDEQQQQVCLGCGSVRKNWTEPFMACNGGCGSHICMDCIEENQSEFCYCCGKCGNCANLINCENCGRYGCSDAKDDHCEMHKCSRCQQGTCQECESFHSEKCAGCGAKISPLWYTDNRAVT